MKRYLTAILAIVVLAGTASAEDARESVKRRTAELMKIEQNKVGEWLPEKGFVAVVGVARMQSKIADEIIAKRHELAEVAIMDAKLKLAEVLGVSLFADEMRCLCGSMNEERRESKVSVTSKIQFLAKHRILGALVLIQSESVVDGVYTIAVSLVWSKGLQKSAEALLDGCGKAATVGVGKYSLKDWLEKKIDPAMVVGPRQYVDDKGVRHFIGFVSMPYDPSKRLALERVLHVKGVATVAWALRSDVETSSVSETILKQTSKNDKECADVTSDLTQRIRQRLRSAVPPVKDLFEDGRSEDGYIVREHPLFPGSKMLIYACELSGEFSEYKYDR